MDPRLLNYYNRELQYIREMGQEFAREFPKIAGRLGLETLECADPYVERLLESFAFLTARVQLKIDSEFPRFTQHLLQMVYPHYLAPTPSMAVVQLQPVLTESALNEGVHVPRGTILRGHTGKQDKTACEYRTAHDVTLWPLELVDAEYSSFLGSLNNLAIPTKPKATIRLRFRLTGGAKFNRIALDQLPLYLPGTDELAMHLHEMILQHTVALLVRPVNAKDASPSLVLDTPTAPMGFDDDQSLLPCNPRSFQGYRLLQEYFAFPARFLFAELRGLNKAIRCCDSNELEILILFDTHDPRLEKSVGPAQFALFCTPIVNLFPRRADRIHITDTQSEYHVVPDRTCAMDFEIFSITEAVGFGTNNDERYEFQPLYSMKPPLGRIPSHGYYTTHRQPRVLSTKQREQGARSSYIGSEVYISLVDPTEAPIEPQLKQLGLQTLCTNRDLPLHLPLGVKTTDFLVESGAPIASVRCISGPSSPKPSYAHGDASWRLISHLSLNYLSITDDTGNGGASTLRELLTLYGDANDPVIRKQIEGMRFVSSQSVSRRLPFPGPACFGRGLEITLTCDESCFEGSSAYLLGMVLDRFFQRHVSINSFSETLIKSIQRGDIARWPARLGQRPVL